MPFADPEREKEYKRQYREKNREKAKERSRLWRLANPEWHKENCRRHYYLKWKYVKRDTREYDKKRYWADPEGIKARKREWQKKNPEKFKAQWKKGNMAKKLSKYNLLKYEFDQMLFRSNGLCNICSQPFKPHPCIDHDHKTGIVRGLLCPKCNIGLGHFQDNIDLLKSAISYLEKHQEKSTSAAA